MISIKTIIILIWIHWMADFSFQLPILATNKWENLWALITHTFIYSLPFFFFGFWFAVLNGISHGCVDFVTSKITHALYEKKRYYRFFVIIGLDQAIHLSIILMLYKYLT